MYMNIYIFLGRFPDYFDRGFSIRAPLSVAQVCVALIVRCNRSRSQFEFH